MMKSRRTSARLLAGIAGRPNSLAFVMAAMACLGMAHTLHAQPTGTPPAPVPTVPVPVPAAPAVVIPPPATAAPAQPVPDQSRTKVKVSDRLVVSVQVKDEDLSTVLEMLSIQSQKNIVASKNVGGKITAALYDVTFYEALDSILHVNGYGYLERGNFIYVYTSEELVALEKTLNKRVAKAIRLNYLNAKDADEFVKPLLSKEGEIKTSKAAPAFAVPADNPTGAEDYALSAVLVVIDYEENIKAIQTLVKELDTRPAQVLVEATILQTALTEANAFGVDFSIIGDLNFSDFIGTGGPLSAANSLIRGGSGSTGVTPLDNRAQAITSNPGNTSGPSTFKIGIISDDVSVFLKLLDQVTNTTILSNPKILTLNRMASRVLVGRRVGYLSTTSTDTSTTQTVEFLDTGTQLYVRPFVSADGDIRLELKPQVSEAIIRDATDSTGAAVSIPDEVTQGLTTNVLVHDGQTIVLGGLFRESSTYGRRQVPGLGDIPVIGAMFRGQDDETHRDEIIFLITPTIVTDTLINKSAERAGADVERLRAGSRQGLLPWSQEKMTSALNVEAERYAREGKLDKAAWCIQRSLALNPSQPDALRLRERITGEREMWSNRSLLDQHFRDEVARRSESIPVPTPPAPHRTPYGSHNLPQEKIPAEKHSSLPVPASNSAPPSAARSMGTQHPELLQPMKSTVASGNVGEVRTVQTTPASNTSLASNASFTSTYLVSTTPTPAVSPEFSLAEMLFPPSADGIVNNKLFGDDAMSQQCVKTLLPMLRGQIQDYFDMNGKFPSLGSGNNRGWSELVDANLLRLAPVNFWAAGPKSDVVVSSENPDTAFNSQYGWVYNPSTGELFAVGFDSTGNPLTRLSSTTAAAGTTVTPVTTTTTPVEHVVVPVPGDPGEPHK